MVDVAYWIDRRVGARGAARARILGRLLADVRLTTALGTKLGMEMPELRALADQLELERIAREVPARGDVERLIQIAWYGSAFADIACPGEHPHRAAALRDGALFNLGIALVDSIVDDRRDARRDVLARALSPFSLRARLAEGTPLDAPAGVQAIVRLFDEMLRSTAERWRGDQLVMARAGAMLSRMYDSEMLPRASRLDAKTLPTPFIALVSDHDRRESVARAAERLGQLVAMLDDWQDLGDDLIHGRANMFVHDRDLARSTARVRVSASARRVLAFRASVDEIAGRLRRALDGTLASADAAGFEVAAKTRVLLRTLLMP